MIRNTTTATMEGLVREAVSEKVSLLATDERSGCQNLGRYYPHDFVKHRKGESVAGAVHTQTIAVHTQTFDGFWSSLKRSIIDTHHKVSAKYLPRYVAELEFRHDNRNNRDIFGVAVARC